MNEIRTVSFVRSVLVTLLCFQLQSLNSAPVPAALSFYDKLYQNASEHNCLFLPKVSKVNYNYTRLKVNRLCDSNLAAKERVSLPEEKNSHVGICNSLSDVFPLLCNVQNGSKNVNISTEVDLMKIGSLNLFCTNLKEITNNISQLNSAKVVQLPLSEASASVHQNNGFEESACLSLCKNARSLREEGFNEYSVLDVHPACILLFKGYTIFQQVVIRNQTTSKTPIIEKLLPETVSNKSPAISVNNDHGIDPATNSKTASAVDIVVGPEKGMKLQQLSKNDIPEIPEFVVTTSFPTDSKKDLALKPSFDASQSEVTKPVKIQEAPAKTVEKVESGTKLLNVVDDKISKSQSEEPSKSMDQQKNVVSAKISSSTSTTTTTVAAVDAGGNDEPLPIENGSKLKSSTAIPKTNDGPSSIFSGKETVDEKNDKVPSDVEKNQMEEDTGSTLIDDKKKQSKPKKKTEETDTLMAELGDGEDDGADYNPGEDVDGMIKPPSAIDDKEEVPQADVPNQNKGYEPNHLYKPPKNGFSGNAFREDLDFSRGTTINVSYNKESEDTGFFSYFLFCVTLIGLMYLVIHNKKKLIAFVVEGKRPRGRSRRSSSSSQYRRLENNFD